MDTATDAAENDQIVREYRDYLDDEADQGTVTQQVKDLIAENKPRLTVNLNHLRKKNPKRSKQLMSNAQSELLLFERALREYIGVIDAVYARERGETARIGFVGVFGGNHFASPRALGARQLGSLIAVDGVVTQCGLVRPKLVRSVHYCPQSGKRLERRYADPRALANENMGNEASAYPIRDEQGNLLETEFGLSEYRDQQAFTLHELAERAPTGQLARAIECVAEGDLVDLVKPGDRVQVVGVYRALPLARNAMTSAQFRTVLIITNIVQIQRDERASLSKDDISVIRRFARQNGRNIIELLTRSIAPSIHGHDFVKEAILCQLLGGVEKRLANGARIRGDVNVLLVGDPSVAKSQLLRFVFQTASRAIATTGRGSTGVGLTAAVTTDPETGERRLEAGATVRGDRGVVCIDEFDKMTDSDRTALHEVMEQGRVTIAKAGIHAHLNARCAVLAAANPIFGRYDVYKTPTENIGLQDSLLSRFDLIFILLDKVDPDADREIAEHVLGMHRYRAPHEREDIDAAAQHGPDVFASAVEQRTGDGEADGDADVSIANLLDETLNENTDSAPQREGDIFESYDQPTNNASNRSRARRAVSRQHKILNVRFLRKFVALAKMMEPQLTKKASSYIAEKYTELRAREQENANAEANMARTQPVTARMLETLIRLSAAFAKARLSSKIEEEDAERAFTLLNYALYKEVLEKPRNRKRMRGEGEGEGDEQEDDEEDEENEEEAPQRAVAVSRKRARVEEDEPARTRARVQESEATVEVSEEVYARVLPTVSTIFHERHVSNIPLATLVESVVKVESALTADQVRAALRRLEDENKIMVADGDVFLI